MSECGSPPSALRLLHKAEANSEPAQQCKQEHVDAAKPRASRKCFETIPNEMNKNQSMINH